MLFYKTHRCFKFIGLVLYVTFWAFNTETRIFVLGHVAMSLFERLSVVYLYTE